MVVLVNRFRGEETLNGKILLQLLQCKSQIDEVKKAREECYQQMKTWWAYHLTLMYLSVDIVYSTLELDTINDMISEKASSVTAEVFCNFLL